MARRSRSKLEAISDVMTCTRCSAPLHVVDSADAATKQLRCSRCGLADDALWMRAPTEKWTIVTPAGVVSTAPSLAELVAAQSSADDSKIEAPGAAVTLRPGADGLPGGAPAEVRVETPHDSEVTAAAVEAWLTPTMVLVSATDVMDAVDSDAPPAPDAPAPPPPAAGPAPALPAADAGRVTADVCLDADESEPLSSKDIVSDHPPPRVVRSMPPALPIMSRPPAAVSERGMSRPPPLVSERPSERVLSRPPPLVSERPSERVLSRPPVASEHPSERVLSRPRPVSEHPSERVVSEHPAEKLEPPPVRSREPSAVATLRPDEAPQDDPRPASTGLGDPTSREALSAQPLPTFPAMGSFDAPESEPRLSRGVVPSRSWTGRIVTVTVLAAAAAGVYVWQSSATPRAVRPVAVAAEPEARPAASSPPPVPLNSGDNAATAAAPSASDASTSSDAGRATAANASAAPGETAGASPEILTPRDNLLRAEAARAQGNTVRARALLEQVLIDDVNNPEAHSILADIARSKGDIAGARAHYESALRQSPRYTPALLGLADIEWDLGERDSAQRRYADLVDRLGDRAPPHAKQRAPGRGEAPPTEKAATPTEKAGTPTEKAGTPPARPPTSTENESRPPPSATF